MTANPSGLRARSALRLGLRWTQRIIVFGAAAALVLAQIPFVAETFGLNQLPEQSGLMGTVLVLTIAALLGEVIELRAELSSAADSILSLHFANPLEVYPHLFERAAAVHRQSERQIDVLGMTLYTAWPSLHFWLESKNINGWHLRLTAHADPEGRSVDWVPADWTLSSLARIKEIQRYAVSANAKSRNIDIEVRVYPHPTSIHGFRLGTGDVWLSCLHWGEDGQLTLDGYSYLFISNDERTPRADALRSLFATHFDAAWGVAPSPTPAAEL